MVARIVGLMVALLCLMVPSDAEAGKSRRVSSHRSRGSVTCKNGVCTVSTLNTSRVMSQQPAMPTEATTVESEVKVRSTAVYTQPRCSGPNCGKRTSMRLWFR